MAVPALIALRATSTRMSTPAPVLGSSPRTIDGTLTLGMVTLAMLTPDNETGDTVMGGATGCGGLETHPVWAGLVRPMPLLVSHS